MLLSIHYAIELKISPNYIVSMISQICKSKFIATHMHIQKRVTPILNFKIKAHLNCSLLQIEVS